MSAENMHSSIFSNMAAQILSLIPEMMKPFGVLSSLREQEKLQVHVGQLDKLTLSPVKANLY